MPMPVGIIVTFAERRMRPVRQTIREAVVLAIAAILLAGAALAQGKPGKQAETLLELANQERANRGLPRLKWDEALASAAQDHAERMARQNVLSHQLAGEPDIVVRAADAGAHFSLVAENIAEGPSLEIIHAGWMGSKPHRENILNPRLDSVGIAVSDRDWQLFAVQDFSQSEPILTIEQQEERIGALLGARGLRLLAKTGDVQQACKESQEFAYRPRPLSVVWFETSDLSTLPDSLKQKLQSGHYKSAMVGACSSNSTPGFTTYRFAVLLY
jgi:uncharacterized protein YkwD